MKAAGITLLNNPCGLFAGPICLRQDKVLHRKSRYNWLLFENEMHCRLQSVTYEACYSCFIQTRRLYSNLINDTCINVTTLWANRALPFCHKQNTHQVLTSGNRHGPMVQTDGCSHFLHILRSQKGIMSANGTPPLSQSVSIHDRTQKRALEGRLLEEASKMEHLEVVVHVFQQ
jgi:hypothetical protein